MSSISSIAASSSIPSNYWCYRCNRFVRISANSSVTCPDCTGGFLEEISTPPRLAAAASDHRRRRHRRNFAVDRTPFNPVIVLRGASNVVEQDRSNNRFELFYDDGAGSGLRPLPSTMSDFLMGSGFDRLLSQLAQIEANGGTQNFENPPASKAAIASMPTVTIEEDICCAVCKEQFEIGSEAREMPCKHVFHQDCILPWLSLRNSCPVCRHEMPTDVRRGSVGSEIENEESVGLTIWRLPGGGFAVGRFSGGRRPSEPELPVVYTEMDGGFSSGGPPRRISWSSRGSRRGDSGGIGQAIRNLFSFRCFGGGGRASASRSSSLRRSWRVPMLRGLRGSGSGASTSGGWALEDGTGNSISRW